MKRAVKVSLKFATAVKLRRLDHLLRRLRRLTNRYIAFIWNKGGGLDAETLNSIPYPSLSYRQRSDCLKYALEMVVATRRSARALGKEASMPKLKRSFKFSCLTASVERGRGSFDYVLKISGITSGKRLVLPFRSHARLNYWLAKPGAKILNGCIVCGTSAVLWIDLPDLEPRTAGDNLGVDLGYNKLLTDSEGKSYGREIKDLCEKVRRKKPGSQAKRRAQRDRKQYINRAVKALPWFCLKLIAVERLKHLKRGKKPNRNKAFRKRMAPWTYRQALVRIADLAQENRVCLVAVDPRDTSRQCPLCKTVSNKNREGEKFRCLSCGHTGDADVIGARNILAKTSGTRQCTVAGPSKAVMS
jgi:hypothetical protein